MHTGEGLHRFVDPVDKSVYLYTQFEVADSRRMFTCFEQPDLKATFAFTVTAPDDWEVVSNQPTPEPEPVGLGNATWAFPPTERHLVVHHGAGRRALPPGRRRVPRRRPGRPARRLLPRLAGRSTSTPTTILEDTRQGFAFFEEAFDTPYPFAKYDQLFVPEFNAGAMENAGCVTLHEDYVFRSRVTEAAYERRAETILHELAHMWFGDLVTMTLVGRPVAQRVVRRVGQHAGGRRGDPVGRRPGRRSPTPTRPGPTGRTSCPRRTRSPPRSTTSRTSRSTSTASPTPRAPSVLKQLVAWVGRDEFLAGIRHVLPHLRVGQHHAGRPAGQARGDLRPRPEGLVGRVAGDRRRQHPAPRVRDRRRRAASRSFTVVQERTGGVADAALAPARHRPVRPRPTRGLVRRRPGRARRGRRPHRGPASWSASRSRTSCWSTTTT